MTTTLDEILLTQDTARKEVFLAGMQIGETIRGSLTDISPYSRRRVAREIIRLIDDSEVNEVQHNLVVGLWYGYDLDEPISLLREELA